MLLLSVTAAAPSEKDAHTKAHVFAYAQETLHSIIAENAVVVFSRARCSGSARIKTYLEDAGIPYYALVRPIFAIIHPFACPRSSAATPALAAVHLCTPTALLTPSLAPAGTRPAPRRACSGEGPCR